MDRDKFMFSAALALSLSLLIYIYALGSHELAFSRSADKEAYTREKLSKLV